MIIYRFRLTSEDQEDFFREIEIQPSQTFLDFHDIILSCADLDSCTDAYFFTTDTHYKKKKEIALNSHPREVQKYDEEMDEMVMEKYVPPLMEKSRMKDFVEDPHQKLVYEFSGKGKYVFFLELFKIIKTEEIVSLPRCVSRRGELHKKVQPIVPDQEEQEEKITPVPPVLPGVAALFAEITEDDTELEEIESNLDEMLVDEGGEDAEASVREPGEMEEQEDDSPEMESLDEYDDLEDLENRSRGFGNESDDY